jgi:hypothetical protein
MQDDERNADDQTSQPKQRLAQTLAALKQHAEFAAMYEGPRKFGDAVRPDLDAELARSIQQRVAKVASKIGPGPLVNASQQTLARELLRLHTAEGLAPRDYFIYRRPGEVMMVRWLAGDDVSTYHQRMQAHFDVALKQTQADEREKLAWRNDEKDNAYLELLDEATFEMSHYTAREIVTRSKMAVMSSLMADAVHIGFLCEQVMGVSAAEVVGAAFSPPADAGDEEVSWFYRHFSLRGVLDEVEAVMNFTFLQKTSDDWFDDIETDDDDRDDSAGNR